MPVESMYLCINAIFRKVKINHNIYLLFQVNPILNAVTDERYNAALLEAEQVDELIAKRDSDDIFKNKPFLGNSFSRLQ